MIEFTNENSFFEYLGLANLEKMHSAFLSWLVSPNCKAITQIQKNNFLEKLFKFDHIDEIKHIGTEIDNIDLVIITNKHVCVIENKLKSSEHSDQLERYKKHVKLTYPGKQYHFLFLTLVNEKYTSPEWKHISYYEIYDLLLDLILLDHKHKILIEEYCLYLSRLLSILKEVLQNPAKFNSVFTNGSKKKSEKLLINYTNEKEEFIAKNQLETIFQKAFLSKILQNDKIIGYNGKLTDTRGTALVDFPLQLDISIPGNSKLYKTFIELQGENIKFAFGVQEDYDNSKKIWIANIVPLFKAMKEHKLQGYTSFNPPVSKAYVSISKKTHIPYWNMSIDDFSTFINNEIVIGYQLTKELNSKILI
jgi:hypothetical protein